LKPPSECFGVYADLSSNLSTGGLAPTAAGVLAIRTHARSDLVDPILQRRVPPPPVILIFDAIRATQGMEHGALDLGLDPSKLQQRLIDAASLIGIGGADADQLRFAEPHFGVEIAAIWAGASSDGLSANPIRHKGERERPRRILPIPIAGDAMVGMPAGTLVLFGHAHLISERGKRRKTPAHY
jgi:hypothetical protein